MKIERNHINQIEQCTNNGHTSEMKEYVFKDLIDSMQLGTNALGSEDNLGIPLLKMGNLRIGGFNFEKLETLIETDSNLLAPYLLRKGDFLFNTRNTLELVGKSSVWCNQLPIATFNSNIMRIKFKKEVDDFYLGFYFSHGVGWNEFKRIATGTTSVAAIYSRDLLRCKVFLPGHKSQAKIAQILSTTDAVIEKTQIAIAKYRAIKQGMLHDLFTRGINVSTGRLRPTCEDTPNLYKESKLGMVPKEWEVNTLDKICLINPIANLSANLKGNDEVSFLKMEDVSNDAEIINNYQRKIRDVSKKGFTPFFENDILFAKITPCMENGKGALARDLKNKFGFGSTEFHVLRAFNEKSIHFLFYLTTSIEFRLKAEGKMSGSAGQQRVPTSFFREFEIAIPLIDEQYAIGLRLNKINQKIKTEQTYLHKLQMLKAGLMGDLLGGKKYLKIPN